ncbi:iron-sulfur cluster repair di-iron protein [Mycobacterium koreense]|uniref:Iron-sulfur cluster repair di-iron protein n=1 Tax=Mycolicibacillus koreensis TaxID=1069220 RepID=A0A7I7SJK8_9MYCO|nr:iron-sulfur cluster repair di-iron protein [Mycolicibacillus koreensis]MCV7247440.1 iron-sulfur cluster repair di-iron protein [Mycolicibacillus koreensis]OSC33936.1 iron-sulfur cluster repair di-iron protein [Mycolicibacillus koreensis]BBY56641.1 iron-sulfur cluster repair di-iron protein [Mycolicibacillus koreensis]
MTTYTPETILGDIVTADPSRTRIMDRFGIDYCCHGQRPVSEACAEAKIDVEELLAALNTESPGTRESWADLGDTALIEHVVDTHHRFLWEEFPRMQVLVDKVARVHGPNHGELAQVRDVFTKLRNGIEPHLREEEEELFPAITARDGAADGPLPEGLRSALKENMVEHDGAGELLAELRRLTDDYTVPADACGSYMAMLAGLEEIESDLHMHVHKENNVLYPRVLAGG